MCTGSENSSTHLKAAVVVCKEIQRACTLLASKTFIRQMKVLFWILLNAPIKIKEGEDNLKNIYTKNISIIIQYVL